MKNRHTAIFQFPVLSFFHAYNLNCPPNLVVGGAPPFSPRKLTAQLHHLRPAATALKYLQQVALIQEIPPSNNLSKPPAPPRTLPPHVNLIYFWSPLSLRGRVIPHTARKVSSICSRHFRHLLSRNSHSGVYSAPTKRRSTAGAESASVALCTRFLFLTREDVVVRAANTPLARGALFFATSRRLGGKATTSPAQKWLRRRHTRGVRDA